MIELPRFDLQRVYTTAIVPDGGSIIIGGLGGYFEWNAESGVPIWRNIPFLGILGGETIKAKTKHQLLIILSAKVILPTYMEGQLFGTQEK